MAGPFQLNNKLRTEFPIKSKWTPDSLNYIQFFFRISLYRICVNTLYKIIILKLIRNICIFLMKLLLECLNNGIIIYIKGRKEDYGRFY